MKSTIPTSFMFASLLVSASVLPLSAQSSTDEGAILTTLVSKKLPSYVSVRVLLKTEFRGGGASRDADSRSELTGVIVDNSGLVMLSNSALNPNKFFADVFGGGEEGDDGVKSTPTDFKVVFNGEEKEYSAFLAATDSKLGLAFIKIEKLEKKQLAPVLFGSTNVLTIGQKVAGVSRLSKGFDYAPYFATGRISGAITKPRKAYVLDGNVGEIGMPVYDMNGEVLGITAIIGSGIPGDLTGDSGGMAMRMLGGGSIIKMFVVPAQAVGSVITQAKLRADKTAALREKKK
ncbi:MAG: serine protease [Chthonomonadaceae bacterium]|nr:serine protease [Chthonomonadaceae bacterium]